MEEDFGELTKKNEGVLHLRPTMHRRERLCIDT